jgi:DNA invertase Pin-like site-specific DNA recombinase
VKGADTTAPGGKPKLHILAALAEFERERIRERVLGGLGPSRRELSLDEARRFIP